MRRADAVDIVALHQNEFSFRLFQRRNVTQIRVRIVAVHAFEFHWASVDQQFAVLTDRDGAKTDVGGDYFISSDQQHSVKVRVLGGPEVFIFGGVKCELEFAFRVRDRLGGGNKFSVAVVQFGADNVSGGGFFFFSGVRNRLCYVELAFDPDRPGICVNEEISDVPLRPREEINVAENAGHAVKILIL